MKNHVDKADERLNLFEQLRDHYPIQRVLYPGCYAHLTPAFVFPVVVFNDIYTKLVRFYSSPEVAQLVNLRKQYAGDATYTYVASSYEDPLPVEDGMFDLLISQYAGFVSRHCKRYLKTGGILVANNSHGDVGLASLDADFELVAVLHRRGEKFSYSTEGLGNYLIPKKGAVTVALLEKTGRGVAYTRPASDYVFQKVA
jgi:SAM-dependent methyltransferase